MKHSLKIMVLRSIGALLAIAATPAMAMGVEVHSSGLSGDAERQIVAQGHAAAEAIGHDVLSRISQSILEVARRNLDGSVVIPSRDSVDASQHYASAAE